MIPIPFQRRHAWRRATAIAVFDEGSTPGQPGTPPQTPLGFATHGTEPGVYTFTTPVLADGSHFLTARVQMIDPANPHADRLRRPQPVAGDRRRHGAAAGLLRLSRRSRRRSGPGQRHGRLAAEPGHDRRPHHQRHHAHASGARPRPTRSCGSMPTSNGNGTAGDRRPTCSSARPRPSRWTAPTRTPTATGRSVDRGPERSGLLPAPTACARSSSRPRTWRATSLPDGAADTLQIFVDTQGPQITDVHITGSPSLRPVRSQAGQRQGPTPLVNSLTISFSDLPAAARRDFLYTRRCWPPWPQQPGNYLLVGDANGIIPDPAIIVVNDPVVDGQPATATIQLVFAQPLPDDRFTLTIRTPSWTRRATSSTARATRSSPTEAPTLPQRRRRAGRRFVARFTVDSRPEIGVTAATRIYLDTNGNFVYDPAGQRRRDESRSDLPVRPRLRCLLRGQLQRCRHAPASGFDKLGAFGWDPLAQQYRFLLDFDHNGVVDFLSVPGVTRVRYRRGRLRARTSGRRNRAVHGQRLVPRHEWQQLPRIGRRYDDPDKHARNSRGGRHEWRRIAMTCSPTTPAPTRSISIWTEMVVADDTVEFGIPDFVERPVVGDLNLDGVDDFGLWVAGNAQKIGEGKAEWYFLVSDRVATHPEDDGESQPGGLASPLFDPYSPDPLGNDLFANYGDRYSLPIFGNFDPPVAGGDGSAGAHLLSYQNAASPLDVNDDGHLSPHDALLVINRLNRSGTSAVPSMMVQYDVPAPYWDVTGDHFVSPVDALVVINALNRQGDQGEGEGALLALPGTVAAATLVTELPVGQGPLSLPAAAAEQRTSSPVPWTNQTWTERTGMLGWLDSTGESDVDAHAWPASDELEELLAILGGDIADQWFRA